MTAVAAEGAADREVVMDPASRALSHIRGFVWAGAAAVLRVVVVPQRTLADAVAVFAVLVAAGGVVSSNLSPAATLLAGFVAPICVARYLADRRLAARVAGSRTGLESTRDVRVELSLAAAERIMAVESAFLPFALIEPVVAWLVLAIALSCAASIVVLGDLPPRPTLWRGLAERMARRETPAPAWAPA
jgi:hypothetical protein